MKLNLQQRDSLPLLAWCVVATPGESAVTVYHGGQVETTANSFIEGAWTGDFQARDIEQADMVIGSAGVVAGDQLRIVADSAGTSWLVSLAAGNQLYISNSMAFVYAMADDQPDNAEPYYYYEMLRYSRLGNMETQRELPTARGNALRLHWACTLSLDVSGELQEIPRITPLPADTYCNYRQQLSSMMETLLRNAADPVRKVRYDPLCSLSSGYDCNASAAIAAEHGAKRAYTFDASLSSAPQSSLEPDSGAEVGRQLGLETRAVDPLAYLAMTPPLDAEFCANPGGGELMLSPLASEFAGSIVIAGRAGDRGWAMTDRVNYRDYLRPDCVYLAGCSITDFRLRTGFLRVDVPAFGLSDMQPLNRLSRSQEMAPWRIGGNYDRPIPRRILEDKGVRRESFGQRKIAGTALSPLRDSSVLSPAAQRSFRKFLGEIEAEVSLSAGKRLSRLAVSFGRQLRDCWRMPTARQKFVCLKSSLSTVKHGWRRSATESMYVYHWGIADLRSRYEVEPAPGSGES